MKVVVTGAAGKIGSRVCRHLHAAGFDVRAVDRAFRADLPVRIGVVNLLDRQAAYGVLDGAEALVHLANHASFPARSDAQTLFNENVTMNMNTFQAACEVGVRKIVFASTVQVFSVKHTVTTAAPGPVLPYLPLDGRVPARPRNPYALSKQVSEHMLRYAAEVYGVCGIAIRFPCVVSDEWIASASRGQRSFQAISEAEGFAYLHEGDAAGLVEACLKTSLTGYHLYFPAAQDETVLADLPTLVARHYADVPRRDPAPLSTLVDISEIVRETGWTPQVNRLPVAPFPARPESAGAQCGRAASHAVAP